MRVTRFQRVCVALGTAAAVVTGTASAAEAHTGSEIIRAACGSGYSIIGTKPVTYGTSTWGYSYLAWNSSAGYNCVVTHKTAYHGTPTQTEAYLAVGSLDTFVADNANYSHYAVVKKYARGACVAYFSRIYNTDRSKLAKGGRWTLGNCGVSRQATAE